MNIWTRRMAVVLSVLLCTLLIGSVVAGYALKQHYASTLFILEPRLARLQGLAQSSADIESAMHASHHAVAPWLHAGGDGAESVAQQMLRQVIDAAGVTVVASQASLDVSADQMLSTIRITTTVTGEWSRIVRLLQAIHTHQPPFWVQSSILNRDGGQASSDTQTARLVLQIQAPALSNQGAP